MKVIFVGLKVKIVKIVFILPDLRRYSDGLPARKGDNYFAEGPYFGLSNGKELRNQKEQKINK